MADNKIDQKRGALIDGLLDRIHWQVDAEVKREDVAELIDSLDEYEMAFVSIPQWTTASEAQRAIDAFYKGDVDARLIETARAVVDGRRSTYKAKNGREVSIEADDGEKVYLVHSDLMFELQCAYEAMADKRRADPVRDFITYVAKLSEAIGFQAGVGGRETAGAIISYLAQHPDKLDAFMKEGVFGWGDTEWITGGCLTWKANDGKVWHPDDARAAREALAKGEGG